MGTYVSWMEKDENGIDLSVPIIYAQIPFLGILFFGDW
jgi:hypothetical protein